MSFMAKNVNMVLLVLLALVVASIAGVSTYYQKSYLNLSINHEVKLKELNETQDVLFSRENKLSEVELSYAQQQEANQEYDKLYSDLKLVKESLDSELAVTKAELEQKITSLAQTIKELNDKNSELISTQAQLTSAEAIIVQRDLTIEGLNTRVDSLRSDLDSCQANSGT